MAKDKKSFLLYCDIIHTVEKLTDEQAGNLFKHILNYVNDRNPITDSLITELTFEPIKQQLKRDLKKYEELVVKRSLAGIASAESRKQSQHMLTSVESVQHTSTNSTDIVIDTVTDIVKDKGKEKRKRDVATFVAPMVKEVEDYFVENKYPRDLAIKFYNGYAIADWHDSKGNKIKNWKQKAVQVWFREENKITTSTTKTSLQKAIRV